MSKQETATTKPGVITELTAFQRTILVILAEDARYGLAIKRELGTYYGSEVNHGRLYPNLDELAAKELVEKSELDKRTNEYALTDEGHRALFDHLHWIISKVPTNGRRAHELSAALDKSE